MQARYLVYRRFGERYGARARRHRYAPAQPAHMVPHFGHVRFHGSKRFYALKMIAFAELNGAGLPGDLHRASDGARTAARDLFDNLRSHSTTAKRRNHV